MIETKRPPNIRREIVGIPVEGAELALHLWRPRGQVKGAVFYFHGLQSHAGWLWEVGTSSPTTTSPSTSSTGAAAASAAAHGTTCPTWTR